MSQYELVDKPEVGKKYHVEGLNKNTVFICRNINGDVVTLGTKSKDKTFPVSANRLRKIRSEETKLK